MQSGGEQIGHVSDTALMVAASRAMETDRADGLVRDPFAARLAGDRGMAILRALERSEMLNFGIGIRSRFLDALLSEAIHDGGIDAVLILGAGLDSRPWRMALPPTLRWIEVDFPAMLEYKRARIPERPQCRLEEFPADLNLPEDLSRIFSLADDRTLLITEGLLMYLAGDTVDAIASAATKAAVRGWLMDLTSPDFARRIGMSTCQSIENVRAANCLDGLQTRELLLRHGWTTRRQLSYSRDVMASAPERVAAMIRKRTEAGLPAPEPIPADDFSGVHLLSRE